MDDIKYTVVEKDMNGIEIVGYTIESPTGNRKTLRTDDIIKLARGNKLSNANALLDTSCGKYILSFDNSLESMKRHIRSDNLEISILGRIINNNKCIGYKAVDNNGKKYNLTISRTWALVEQGVVKGLIAKINGTNKVLIGTDECVLEDLPKNNT